MTINDYNKGGTNRYETQHTLSRGHPRLPFFMERDCPTTRRQKSFVASTQSLIYPVSHLLSMQDISCANNGIHRAAPPYPLGTAYALSPSDFDRALGERISPEKILL
jgi:hypothetical protein